jgi:ATP-dependent DNA ligase
LTIDGEAVVLGPDGLSRFDELRRREAAHSAMLYAFDLIEHDGLDLRDLPFLDCKAALARLVGDSEAGILFNEHVAGDGPSMFEHARRLVLRHRVEADRRHISIGPVFCLDQDPESRQRRSAEGVQRAME